MNSVTTGETKQFTTPLYSTMIMSKFLQLRTDEKLCDVFISDDSIIISAHSFILAAASPFMMRYISSRTSSCLECTHQKRLDIPVTSITKMMNNSIYNCMECVLKIIVYIYTGCIGIADDHFDHIVNITCNLEIEELLAICRDYNTSKISSHSNLFQNKSSVLDSSISKQAIASYDVHFDSCISHTKPLKITDITTKIKTNDSGKLVSNLSSSDVKERSSEFSNKEIDINSIIYNSSLDENEFNRYIDEKHTLGFTECHSSYMLRNGENSTIALHSRNNKNAESNTISRDLDVFEDNSHIVAVQVDLSKNKRNIFNADKRDLDSSEHTRFDQLKSKSYKFVCSSCSFGSNSFKRSIKHILKEKHGNKCSICSNEFKNNESLIQHILSNHNFGLLYSCHECSLNFKSRHSFKSHLLTHEESSVQVECNICKLAFRSKSAMELHVLERHNNYSVKTCEFCSYTTKFSSYLKRHLLKHYRKLLTCTFQNCNFSTVWKNNLKSHLKMHQMSEKAFKCDTCSMQFSLKKNLQRHVSLMHTKCKIFTCSKCKYSNKRFDKLKSHYRTVHDDLIKINEQNDNIFPHHNGNTKGNSLTAIPMLRNSVNSTPMAISEHMNDAKFGKNPNEDCNSGRVVYLNESTGELTFFCDSDGKPLQGVPDVITVHSIGGMKNKNSFESSNSAGLFLNEITGELSCSQLNFNLTSDSGTVDKPPCPSPEVTVTVLDETTGEITSKHEQIAIENDLNINDFDNIFDTIDFDAMNDDSLDGFDDFDNALFEAEFSIGPSSPDMDKILNEFTGELFTDQTDCQHSLDKPLQPSMWENKNPLPRKSDKHLDSRVEELAQIFLDEVTGELIGEFSSILN